QRQILRFKIASSGHCGSRAASHERTTRIKGARQSRPRHSHGSRKSQGACAHERKRTAEPTVTAGPVTGFCLTAADKTDSRPTVLSPGTSDSKDSFRASCEVD